MSRNHPMYKQMAPISVRDIQIISHSSQSSKSPSARHHVDCSEKCLISWTTIYSNLQKGEGTACSRHFITRGAQGLRPIQIYPLWRAFSRDLCVYGERFHRLRVDGRPKRIKKFAFTSVCVYNRLRVDGA